MPELHEGVKVLQADLKTAPGQEALHRGTGPAATCLLTSFRPSALAKLGLAWKVLHSRYPELSQVAIVSAAGARGRTQGTTSPTSPNTAWCRACGTARFAVCGHGRIAHGFGGRAAGGPAQARTLCGRRRSASGRPVPGGCAGGCRGLPGTAPALGTHAGERIGGRCPCGLPDLSLQGWASGGGGAGTAFRGGAACGGRVEGGDSGPCSQRRLSVRSRGSSRRGRGRNWTNWRSKDLPLHTMAWTQVIAGSTRNHGCHQARRDMVPAHLLRLARGSPCAASGCGPLAAFTGQWSSCAAGWHTAVAQGW